MILDTERNVITVRDNGVYMIPNSNNTTEKNERPITPLAVDTIGLMQILCCGRKTATEIGEAASARIQVGRRLLWNVRQIQNYLDDIAE